MGTDEQERKRGVNKVRASVKDRVDRQNRLAAAGQTQPGLFNPTADISKGIARRADPGDPEESPNNFRPLPGAPIDANAGQIDRGSRRRARNKVAARRYGTK